MKPLFLTGILMLLTVRGEAAAAERYELQFVDSATGFAVQPESVHTRAHSAAPAEKHFDAARFKSGRAALELELGRHTVTVVSANHYPMSADVEVAKGDPYSIRFLLDPLVEPKELQFDYISGLRKEGYTLIVGFVSDEEEGGPMEGVKVFSAPAGVETTTDARGFFQIYLPAKKEIGTIADGPANLVFERRGYTTQERQFVELSSGGDWKYKVSLKHGGGKEVVDERMFRRSSVHEAAHTEGGENGGIDTYTARRGQYAMPQSEEDAGSAGPIEPRATALTNSTVRVPRNIRVLQSNGTTVDYVTMDTYAKHVLPSEWIAGWGNPANYPGGSNSLNAGAVAVRCYAIVKLNGVGQTSPYDICATTSCQVYNPASSSSFTDAAVGYTANWVVVSSSGVVSTTEYSAENNSLGNSCGDSFTEPSTTGPVCIFDPVCTGETRNGHGRGMCQWGSAKWASGRKFPGNVTSTSSPTNGYPRRDWTWIVRHYYPTLFLVKGAPLVIGDDVKALKTLDVRACADGSISNGMNCALVTTKAANATGTIVGGPQQITVDGGGTTNGPGGFTWYQVQWSDSTIGWSAENFLERIYFAPSAPTNVSATAAGTNQINLSWADSSGGAADSFKIERAVSSSGPWIEITNIDAGFNAYADKNLFPGSAWFYRLRGYNPAGNSGYSSIVSASTSNAPPVLAAISNRTVVEGAQLTFTNSASGPDISQLITDFEPFPSEGSNGIVMFRDPRFSGSTSTNVDAAPDLALVTDTFVTNGNGSAHALRIACNFTNAINPWLRLTTASAAIFPNPVIDFTKWLRFSIYADKAIQVAVACRETVVPSGTIGSDGGTSGGIEWAGVTNVSGGAPMPARSVTASNWTVLTFDLPNEPIRNFSGGNGVLSTASGFGTLEHIAIVPSAGTGLYNIYLDNIAVVTPRLFTYNLGPGAPAGAAVNATNGVFTWTPNELQGPSTNTITVIVTDNGSPPQTATNTLTVVVNETNSAPLLTAISDRIVHAGMNVTFTNSATDPDIPANTLTYSLDAAPPNATIGALDGIFNWLTSDAYVGTTNPITVRVTDDGAPPKFDAKSFNVTVVSMPGIQALGYSVGTVTIAWSSIPGIRYRVQFSDDLSALNWTDLGVVDVLANSFTTTVQDTPGVDQRFYRIRVVQ